MWLYYFPWRKHHDFKKAKLKIDNENLEKRNQILLSRLRLCQKANRSKHLLTSENVSKEYTFENYRGSKRDHKSIITNNNRIEPTKITEVMSKTDEEFECVSNGSFNVNEISSLLEIIRKFTTTLGLSWVEIYEARGSTLLKTGPVCEAIQP